MFDKFWTEGHQERGNEVGSLTPAKRLDDLNQLPSQSYHNAWTHCALSPIHACAKEHYM